MSHSGSSLGHSSESAAERAYPARLGSSPGTASDSTTDAITNALVAHDEFAESLEAVMEEDGFSVPKG